MDNKNTISNLKNELPGFIIKSEGVEYHTECKNNKECLKAIREILDNEATEEQIVHFKQNIDKCLPCIDNYNLEVSIRKVLCDKIQKIPVPSELINSIRAKIEEI